jgi:hypothetical protein
MGRGGETNQSGKEREREEKLVKELKICCDFFRIVLGTLFKNSKESKGENTCP